jgi:peptide/nickel transport system permease protein
MSDIRNSTPGGEDYEPQVSATGTDAVGLAAGGSAGPLPGEDKSYSQGQLVARRFFRHKAALTSMIVLGLIIVVAFTSIGTGPIPGWWPHSYTLQYDKIGDGAPTWAYPFGQDTGGKDYFALVMRGTQFSLIIAFSVGIISTIVGTLIGALAGFYRGWVESILMRLTDVFIVIPLLVVAAVLGKTAAGWGIWGLALVLGLITWTGLARLVRGEVLSLRERAAQLGGRDHRVRDALDLQRDPARDRAQLPRLRCAGARHVAGHAHRRLPVRLRDPALAVLVARPDDPDHRPVRELHRRRPA